MDKVICGQKGQEGRRERIRMGRREGRRRKRRRGLEERERTHRERDREY